MIVGVNGEAGSGKDTVADYLIENHRFVKVSLADEMKRFCKTVYDFSEQQLWGPSEFRNAPDKRYLRPDHTWAATHGPKGYNCMCCGWDRSKMLRDNSGLDIDGNPDPGCFLSPRYALQTLGTEWGRHCYPLTWVKVTVRTVKSLEDRADQGVYYTPPNGIFMQARADSKENPPPYFDGVSVPDVRFQNEIDAIRAAGGKLLRVRRPGAGLEGAQGQHQSEAEQRGIPDSSFDYVIENDQDLDYLRSETGRALATFMGVEFERYDP